MTFDVGSVIHDRYRVVRKLGEGGMGTVYEVEHVQLARRLALKTLHPELVRNADVVARFQREARSAAAVGSPHIVDVVDLGTADGSPFIVMEFLDGPSLRALLEEHGQLQVSRALGIVAQCCKALAAAHAKGIVHRDLKPDNIMVLARDGEDFIKIVDFGIAKLAEAAIGIDAVATTRTGVMMGTPQYMSPEQLSGQSDIDARADVWAMGCVLFELLTGRPPFDAPTVPLLSVRVLSQATPSMRALRPAIPARLDAIVQKALAKERADRYPTIAALGAAIDALKMAPAATTRRPAAEPSDDELTFVDTSPAGAPTGPSRNSTTPRAWDAATTAPPRRTGLALVLGLGAVGLCGLTGAVVLAVSLVRTDPEPQARTLGELRSQPVSAPGPAAPSDPGASGSSPASAVTAAIPPAPSAPAAPAAVTGTPPEPAKAPPRSSTPARASGSRRSSSSAVASGLATERPAALAPALPSAPAAPPIPREPSGRRLVIRNTRQLAATVTLTCGDGPPTTLRVPAGATRTLTVDGPCRSRCDDGVSVGSLCGTRLAASATSLVIR